jgi:ribonuclease T2
VIAALVCTTNAFAYDDNRPHAFLNAAPGNVDYYALVLSWSPTHCLSEKDDRDDRQCDPGRPEDFVLHGFWPQYAKGWPEDCYTGQRPWVPSAVIDQMHDIMPSKQIVIHEYKTHGTCTGMAPDAYFAAARKAYEQVTIPAVFNDPRTQRFLSPEDVEKEFIAANDWLKPDMIAVTCRRGKLFDVRICFSDDIQPQVCGANFDQKALCPLNRITVTVP